MTKNFPIRNTLALRSLTMVCNNEMALAEVITEWNKRGNNLSFSNLLTRATDVEFPKILRRGI